MDLSEIAIINGKKLPPILIKTIFSHISKYYNSFLYKGENVHEDRVVSLCVANNIIVSGDQKGIIKFWNGKSGECIKTINNNDYIIKTIILDSKIYVGFNNGNIKIYDLNGEYIKTLHVICGLTCFFIDKNIIISEHNDGNICILNCDTNEKQINKVSDRWIDCITIYNDVIISGSRDHTIKIFNYKTKELVKILHGHSDHVTSVTIYNNMLISGDYDGIIKFWDIKTFECIKTLNSSKSMSSLTISEDIIVSNHVYGSDICVNIIDAVTGECIKTLVEEDYKRIFSPYFKQYDSYHKVYY